MPLITYIISTEEAANKRYQGFFEFLNLFNEGDMFYGEDIYKRGDMFQAGEILYGVSRFSGDTILTEETF